MRLLLLLTFFALPIAQADPVQKPRAKPQQQAPAIPDKIQIKGDYSIKYDAKKKTVRYTGLFVITDGKSEIKSTHKKAWAEFHQNGNLRLSKSRWESKVVRD